MAQHESGSIRFHTLVGGWSASGRALTPAHLVVDGDSYTLCGVTTVGKQGVPDDGRVKHCQNCLLVARSRGILFQAKVCDVAPPKKEAPQTEKQEYDLAARVRAANIPLWRLRRALGDTAPSEATLSRRLRGLDPMTPELAARIEAALVELREGAER